MSDIIEINKLTDAEICLLEQLTYGDELKEDMFVDHVGRVSVKSIVRTAKERSPGADRAGWRR